MVQSSTGKKGCRKAGRNTISCKAYRLSNRKEHNQLRRLKKLLVTHPNDTMIVTAIEKCQKLIRGY